MYVRERERECVCAIKSILMIRRVREDQIKHCLILNHACTSMHDQTNTRPTVCRLNGSNSVRSLDKHPKTLPDAGVFRGAPPGLALNFLFGTLKKAVDCDVITDLGTEGSVTMSPSGVATATSPSTAAFSLVWWTVRLFGHFFLSFCFFICALQHFSGPLSVTNATLTMS